MILYPAFPIRVVDLDLMIISDHPRQQLGSIYKLYSDHTSKEVVRLLIMAEGLKTDITDACEDLSAYVKVLGTSKNLAKNPEKTKDAFVTAARLLTDSAGTVLQIGVELDIQTLEPRHYLVLGGLSEQMRVPLKLVRGKLK